jgi:hypothetical protein
MAGQEAPSLAGSWGDMTAVGLSDNAMQNIMNGTAPGGDPGDLNDTIPGPNGVNTTGETITGNGDLMSNAFVADFFASHPGLDQDQVGQNVLQSTEADAPALEAYIAQAQGLTNVDAGSSMDTGTASTPGYSNANVSYDPNYSNANASYDSGSSNSSYASSATPNSAQWQADNAGLAAALGSCGCHCYLAAGQSIEF